MYHRVWEGVNDKITVTPKQLREHFSYLRFHGYSSISLPVFLDVLAGKVQAPPRSFLLTFDDGYKNNMVFAYPLLKEYGYKAVFFIIGNTLNGKAAEEKEAINEKMTLADLQKLDPSIVQLALHGYNHTSYGDQSLNKIKDDITQNIKAFEKSGCNFFKVLAYPYGQRPSSKTEFDNLKKWMREDGIITTFRIGNKPCRIPPKDDFVLKRIDISGQDTIRDFGIKLKKGKLKPF